MRPIPTTVAVALVAAALAPPTAAQQRTTAARAAPAQSATQPPEGFLEEISGQFEASASKLVALAEAMPESTYDWSPGEGVASVARVYMHIAHYNYMYPHENMGRDTPVPPSEYGRWEDRVTDKPEVLRILRASMDYVRSVMDASTAAQLGARTTLYGRDVAEWAVLLQLVAHMNEHLGQSIAYARTNGIVPPWSR